MELDNVGMYDDVRKGVSEDIEIMGMPFYAENIDTDEPYNRREREFTQILGGTERVTKGKYVHREFNFSTSVYFPDGRPDVYDHIFKEMMSKPVPVISPYMGNFNALVTIRKSFPEASPNHMELDVNIVEVPDVKSNIPGESFTVPTVKKVKSKTKISDKNKKNNNSKKSNSNSKTKNNSKSKTKNNKNKNIKKKNK